MNIGKWIVVAFVLFTTFIATLVTICMRQDISLVSKNYYKEELAYQEQIQRLNNTSCLKDKPAIKIVDQKLQVEFSQFAFIEKGELKIFCPSNDKMDRNYKLSTTGGQIQVFDVDDLKKGMYRVKMLWNMNGKEFYHEEIVNI
jgi:hypothetical protein